MERLSIISYIRNGHNFHLYVYSPVKNIPLEVFVLDANEIVSKQHIFLDSRNGVAAFSDYFRYKLLFEKGGWWVDLDTVCLSYFDFEEDYCFATEKLKFKDGNIISTAFIKSPPKADFLNDCIRIIEEYGFDLVPWGVFGPTFLSEVLEFYDSNVFIKRPEIFCPIPWYETHRFIQEGENLQFKDSRAIHLWNEMWRIENIDKYATYSSICLYEKLKKKYFFG